MPVIPPKISSPYRLMIVGEAPGADEDLLGRPFVGKAGRILRDNMPTGWEDQVYWTNTVRCRPTKDNHKANRTPEQHEIKCCSSYLQNDLVKIKPHAILALGDIALKWFWEDANVTKMRGVPFPTKLKDGTTSWVVTSFHPSYIMRQNREDFDTRTIVNPFLPVFKNDLKDFFSRAEWFSCNPPKVYEPPLNKEKKLDFIYPKTPQEVLALFLKLEEPFAVDLETIKFRPYMRDARILTAAFSDGKITFAYPVCWPGAAGWGLSVFNEMMSMDRHWIAQGAAMEYNWIWASTGKWDQKFEDTEALARLLHRRTGLGKLAVLSRIYLGFDSKQYLGFDSGDLLQHLKYPLETVLEYNALDAWSEKHIFDILVEKVSDMDIQNYIRIIDTIKSTVAMERKGLEVDLTASERLQKYFQGKMAVIEQKAREVEEVTTFEKKEGRTFRLSEPETVGDVLVNYCGIELPKTEKGKQYSTDEKDLEKFVGKHPLIDIILDSRGVAKLLSTYIDPVLSGQLFGTDGLIHPQYKVCHVATYRLSSELPNIQNWPKRANSEIREQIVAPKGHILAAYDYGQLEGRVIAMFSRDKNLIKSFITEEDIHWKWLYRIIDLYPDYMDRLKRISGETEEKAILKAGRTIIKTDFVFASFYGATSKSLHNRTQIPFNIADRVWQEFWACYPQAKEWVDGQFRLYSEKGYVQSLTDRVRNEVLKGNEPCNSPSQGTAAELVLEAQNALFSKSMAEDPYYQPRINIHDDLVFVFPDDDKILGDYVESTGKEIVEPRFPFVTVPLSSECRVGYNWNSLEKVHIFNGPYFQV